MMKRMGIEGGITIDERGWHQLPVSPFVTEEMGDGQPRQVAYMRAPWDVVRGEKTAKVVVPVTDIPCSVVVD
jgi:hypothetical protein